MKNFKESGSHILNNSKNEFHMLVVLLNAHEYLISNFILKIVYKLVKIVAHLPPFGKPASDEKKKNSKLQLFMSPASLLGSVLEMYNI